MSVNPNLAIWISDCHVTETDAEDGALGEMHPKEAFALGEHIVAMEPAGVFDTGDCKDWYLSTAVPPAPGGGATLANLNGQHANYLRYVMARMPWFALNADATSGALRPVIPGNHDEIDDYTDLDNGNEFSMFTQNFWPAPYHYSFDWTAPKVRFLVVHSYIIHAPDVNAGFAEIDVSETTWLTSQLAALPVGWKAIVCAHFPMDPAFGTEIKDGYGGDTLRTILAANNTKIVACLNGHRHANMNHATLNGITHFNGGSTAYTQGNARGGFMPIEYVPGSSLLRFHYRYGPATDSFYGPFDPATYTPVDVSL